MPTLATSKFNEITENYLLLNVVWYILLSFATVLVMWYYSEKNLPWHIRISVFIALGASLSIVIMVPWDVSNVYHLRCQNTTYTQLIDGKEPTCPADSTTITKESQEQISEFLHVSWNVVFYITNVQGWFLLQVQQAYNDAGQFTRWGRFSQALKENVAVIVLMAGLLAVMVGYNIFIEKQDNVNALFASIGTLVAFLSQASVCALLGHGLIEVPRYYWSRRNTETWLDKTYSDLVRLQMNQESARKELKEKMRLLSHYNINVRHQMNHDFGRMIDLIMQAVPPGLNIELPDDTEIREMEYNANDHNVDALVSLHASIKGAVTSFSRASAIYNRACVAGCFLEDVVLTKSYRKNNDGVITSSLRKQARSRLRLLWQKMEYYRYVVLWKYTSILMTLLMVLMSLTLMVSELTLLPQLNENIPKDDRDKAYGGSILYWVADISKFEGSGVLVTVIVLFLLYMCFCLYFTLLRVKVFSLYEVVPGHTDGTSLLIQCYLVTRLVPAVCYNFLDMLRELSTDKKSFKSQFEQSRFGGQSSFAGISFDRYLPTTIVVVSVLVAFNFFSKMSAYFRGSNPHQADFMQQGRALLKLERAKLEQQAVFVAGRNVGTTTRLVTRIKQCFKGKDRDVVRASSSGAVELQDLAEGDRSPLSPVRSLDSSSYVPEDDV